MARRLEHAVAEEWTPEAVARAGVSDIAVREIRAGRMTPEEGLIAAIFASDALLEAGAVHARDELHLVPGETKDAAKPRQRRVPTPEELEAQRKREKDRYHNDPEYREARLAQMRERRRTPEFRQREAERKRRYRARKKVQS